MACPKIEVRGKRVIPAQRLSWLPRRRSLAPVEVKDANVKAGEELRQSARLHPDAVAFGYVAGSWVPAA